jgi:arsenate reductase
LLKYRLENWFEKSRTSEVVESSKSMKRILFACVHNAGRSQMAAALFNRYVDDGKATAFSAGTAPAERVHPEVLEAMKEIDIDLTGISPQRLTDELARSADVLVTMGCGDACPVAPGTERLDWPLEDPKGKSAERVRAIRNDVRDRVRAFIAARRWTKDDAGASVATIVPAQASDEEAVRRLLADARLPLGGLALAFPGGYAVARTQGIVGCAGMEVHDRDGLLRSVAVRATGRHAGLGARLVEDRLAAARSMKLEHVYLITTTAAPFFERLGFEKVERDAVPAGIRRSEEFASICPGTAAVLRKAIGTVS